jgi:hypothetical protein
MCARLNSNIIVHRLAADLGLRGSVDPVRAILAYCHRVVKAFLVEYPDCPSPAKLLDFLANKLSTRLVEIHTEDDLQQTMTEYASRGERAFATLEQELRDAQSYAITIKLQKRQPWESAYVSIIDCRGSKRLRSYHTKWHELGHLLILTDQTRLAFRRTHDPTQPKSAEESLVDTIAGEFSFYPRMIKACAKGEISFEKIAQIRSDLCPDASLYSSILNVSKQWPTACVWVEAKLAQKKSEQANGQQSFGFRKTAPPALRAVHATLNDAARQLGIATIPHFRVPSQSVIHRIFYDGPPYGEADENLGMWESSDGTRLPSIPVRVKAKRIGDSIHALVIPLSS